MLPAVSVVVLGYGAEPHLEPCLAALARDVETDHEVVLVDNGIEGRARREADWPAHIRVVGDGDNLGFAGGCNLGAARAVGEVLVFVNSDALVRPGALATLRRVVEHDSTVGIACGCLRLADRPDLVNSVGNPLHWTGITWAGSCGEPAARHEQPGEVAVATGGLFAVRRAVWHRLGGFDERYFAYHEDTDLSLRAWLLGLRVVVEPSAVADHHYEFGRNPRKMYLLERNRLLTVLGDYPTPLLRRLLPGLLLVEPLLLLMAVLQGWAPQKLQAWWWVSTHAGILRRRRAAVQAEVRGPDAAARVAGLMTDRIEPPMVAAPPGMGLVNGLLAAYWRLATRGLPRPGRR